MSRIYAKRLALLMTVLSGAVVSGVATAAVVFDFTLKDPLNPFPGGVNAVAGSSFGGNDGTRFFQERVDIDGVNYFHIVVGDPATGFALESYVTSATVNTAASINGLPRPSSPDGGGNERALIGSHAQLGVDQNEIITQPGRQIGNAKDPFGVTVDPASGFKHYDLSGNGTMNPNRAMLRMVVSDAQMSQEVFKPLLTRKPLVSQTTSDSEIIGQFVADMRELNYSDRQTAAPVFNRLSVQAPGLLPGAADFDMSQVQRSNVSAGRYSYQAGQGWLIRTLDPQTGQYVYTSNPTNWDTDNSVFDEGTYTYADGAGFNLEGVNWGQFFDYQQNAEACSLGFRAFAICPQ